MFTGEPLPLGIPDIPPGIPGWTELLLLDDRLIIIALGDVAVSFSSIIDESNDELYKGLRDDDIVVKKNTLMVLTHLILNGMIKVKGQMGEMAKCVEDEDERIADLAKLFFQELSTKDNAIYNNLPDGASLALVHCC